MRRRAPLIALIIASAILSTAAAAAPAMPAVAAHRAAATESPTVEVYAADGGIVSDSGDLSLSVVIDNPGADPVPAGHVTVSVTTHPVTTRAALTALTSSPGQAAKRRLGSADTSDVAAGAHDVVATVTVPVTSAHLPSSSPGVFGLIATVTTPDGAIGPGVGTLVVPGSNPATVGVAAVMPLTVPARSTGLITSQEIASYTAPDGLLTRELMIAESNPRLTIGIDPMILVSIRVLGQSAPATAQTWLTDLQSLPNDTFPLQYGDADPGLQTQAGLAAPLQPTDFTYAMSPGEVSTPLTVGEPTESTDTPTPQTPTPTPTGGVQMQSLSALVGWQYKLGGIAWPAPSSVRASDIAAFGRAGMPTTIVSGSNTNAASLPGTPDAVMSVSGGTALVTDDGVSDALAAAATATDAVDSAVADSALEAQLALAAASAQSNGVILASLGRIWPTDASRAASAVTTALDSPFSRSSGFREALTAPPTTGLALVDKRNPQERVEQVGTMLDLAGEQRSGGTAMSDNIATFSSVLANPVLLTGEVRARLLDLFSAGWAGSPDWQAAAGKEITALNDSLTAVQIVSPESIRQASRQALIPITVTNKLDHPVDVVLRATPSSARLEVDSDTEKTIAAGSSAKVLVPVKAQLGNGTVWLALQLYSRTDVRIGNPQGAEIDVHADWEGIGAVIFGIVVIGFFGFGLFRTIQRRRRERAHPPADAGGGDTDGEPAHG